AMTNLPLPGGGLTSTHPSNPFEIARTLELVATDGVSLLRFQPASSSLVRADIGSRINQLNGLTVPPPEQRAYVTTLGSTVLAVDLATNVVVNTVGVQSPVAVTSTPSGASACSYHLDTGFSSWSKAGGTGTVNLSTDCAWQASSIQPWVRLTS